MSKRRVVSVAVAVAIVSAGMFFARTTLAGQQTAKPQPQPAWLFMNVVKVLPGATEAYIELQTKEVMPAQRKGGSLGRQAWSSGVTGAVREIVYFSPIESFAQFDKPNPMNAALGEAGAAALNAKTSKLAEQMRTMIVRTRPDLSYVPNPEITAPLALVTFVDVTPGRRADFEAFISKDVLPAIKKANAKSYRVLEVVYGDSTNSYFTAIGYDTYEAIGKGHPFQLALGDDGAQKLDAKVTGMVSRVERFISRQRPELSWSPQADSK